MSLQNLISNNNNNNNNMTILVAQKATTTSIISRTDLYSSQSLIWSWGVRENLQQLQKLQRLIIIYKYILRK